MAVQGDVAEMVVILAWVLIVILLGVIIYKINALSEKLDELKTVYVDEIFYRIDALSEKLEKECQCKKDDV